MTSERRKQSSRANGAKSRGPVTPEGKARSSHNSYRHGLLSKDLVLDQENPQSLLELLAALELTFAPADEFELSCVETMAAARWRVLRIWGMETAGFQQEIDHLPPQDADPSTVAAAAFKNLADNSRFLDLMARYESQYDRQFARAFNLLNKHRGATRPNEPNPISEHYSAMGQTISATPAPLTEPAPNTPLTTPPNEPNPIPEHYSAVGQTIPAIPAPLPAPTPNAPLTTPPNEPNPISGHSPARPACYPRKVTVEERGPFTAGMHVRVASERRLQGVSPAEILPASGGSGGLGSQAKSCSLSSGSKGFGWSAIGKQAAPSCALSLLSPSKLYT